MKGKALRRALATSDVTRIGAEGIPLIQDTTELITPELAYEMLAHNKGNRPINWKRVEEYAAVMARGEWKLHAQGIILDTEGNVLTGQKRLWAVIYSATNVWMRVSRGSPPDTARIIDRHDPQSARDLASRGSGHKHKPTEASIARGMLALAGVLRPSVDQLAEMIGKNSPRAEVLLRETVGTKKTRAVLMLLAAASSTTLSLSQLRGLAIHIDRLADALVTALLPIRAETCWGRGAAFQMAMVTASDVVKREGSRS